MEATMSHFSMISDTALDTVVGGTARPAMVSRSTVLNAQKTNNSNIVLQNMSLNAPTSGGNNIGGLAISVVQGIN